MGQKVHPKSFRLGVNKSWSSRWFVKKGYADVLHRDLTLRRAIAARLPDSGIAKVEIERTTGQVKVHIFTSKPGIIIGRQGAAIEQLRSQLSAQFGEKIEVNIVEVAKPDMDAQLIAESIAGQIERRLPYRRAAKQTITRSMENGLLGVKVRVAGRLNGAEISRDETFREGNVPLHTLRANVDYGFAFAKTMYGTIGVKVWTYSGEVFTKEEVGQKDAAWLAEGRRAAAKAEESGRLEAELKAA